MDVPMYIWDCFPQETPAQTFISELSIPMSSITSSFCHLLYYPLRNMANMVQTKYVFYFYFTSMMFTYKLSNIIAPKIYIRFKQYFSNFWWLKNSIKHLIKNNSIKNYCIWI